MRRTREEAIAHFLPKKISNELDLAEIKTELFSWGFTKDEIAAIAKEISIRELDTINSSRKNTISTINGHLITSYIMIFVCIAVILLCMAFLYWVYFINTNLKLGKLYHLAPYGFIFGAVLLFGKHMRNIRIHRRK